MYRHMGGGELSATDSVLQTRRADNSFRRRRKGRRERCIQETEVVRKSGGQPIR